MILPQFDYAAPKSLNAVVQLLAEKRGAMILAGGLSLLIDLKLKKVAPSLLIDLRKIAELRGITEKNSDGGMQIGPMTTCTEIAGSKVLRERYPALVDAALDFGDLQVRNRSTLGGNLACNDPAGDLPAVIMALDGTVNILGPTGLRTVPAEGFFMAANQTALAANEIITSIDLPWAAGFSAYEKFKDPANGYATCGVAASMAKGSQNYEYRLAVAGAYQPGQGKVCPVCGERQSLEATFCGIDGAELVLLKSGARRLPGVEAALLGKDPSPQTFAAAFERMEHEAPLCTDLHASGEYRAHLMAVLGERALVRAAERARAS